MVSKFWFFDAFKMILKQQKSALLKACLIIFFVSGIFGAATAQVPEKLGLDPEKWAVLFSKGQLNEVNSLGSLMKQLVEADSLQAAGFLVSLEKSNKENNHYFKTFFCMVKAGFFYAKYADYDKYKDRRTASLLPIKKELMKLYAEALDAAYQTEDQLLIGWVNFYSARRILHFGEISWAVMYAKNGVDLFEKVDYAIEPHVYTELAELLHQVREYDESISYGKKGIAAWKTGNYEEEIKEPHKLKVKAYNAIGSSFYQKYNYDSAASYWQQAYRLATDNLDTVLAGKVSGNIGKIFYAQSKFDSAWILFKTGYYFNSVDSIYNEAAHASIWMAKANLAKGNKVGALSEAKEALRLLKLWPSGNYLRDTYYTLTQIYKAMGNYDSAFYYSDSYLLLNDSLEREVATSSLAISNARLESEESRYKIQKINKEKEKQLFIRNSLMAGILASSIIFLLIINRGRLKSKMALERAESEKILMEQEIQSAKEQISAFTGNIVEKTGLISLLEEQLRGKKATTEQQLLITELTQKTILTEDDWLKFKLLFDKVYPTFFQKLKKNAAEITVAEQRMAALTRLELTSKQMAAMLGISVDSVHKTRQRLRQRLQLGSDTNLEDYIAGI